MIQIDIEWTLNPNITGPPVPKRITLSVADSKLHISLVKTAKAWMKRQEEKAIRDLHRQL